MTVLPAYAGMIPYPSKRRGAMPRAPRIRGDDPLRNSWRTFMRWCSPHTRG